MGNCAHRQDEHVVTNDLSSDRLVRANSQFDLEARGLMQRNLSLKNSLMPTSKCLIHPAGTYRGVINGEQANGHGALDTNTYVYEGEWRDGKPNGKGEIRYKNGTVCTGQFIDGLPEGVCKLYSADGFTYNGEFHNGLFEGQGEATWADGRRYVGSFKRGRFDGEGEYNWPDGRVYQGSYKEGVRHGKGTVLAPNSYKVDAYWIEGNTDGNVLVTQNKNLVAQGKYISGKFMPSGA